MKATVSGKVLAKQIIEPKEGSSAKTKYLISIHQPGEMDAAKVEVNAKQYQEMAEGKDVSIPVSIGAWKTERSYGLNVRAVQ